MWYNTDLILTSLIYSVITIFICIGVIAKKKYNFLIDNIITYVTIISFLVLQYFYHFDINIFVLSLVLLTLFIHHFIGQYLNYYYKSKYFDRFLHILGSFSFSIFSYLILEKIASEKVYSKIYVFIIISAIGISLGSILEIYEFTLDSIKHSKNQKGQTDTNFDIISNIIGSIVAAIFYIIAVI